MASKNPIKVAVEKVKSATTKSKTAAKPRKRAQKTCPFCNGSGLHPEDFSQLCPKCGGSGKV